MRRKPKSQDPTQLVALSQEAIAEIVRRDMPGFKPAPPVQKATVRRLLRSRSDLVHSALQIPDVKKPEGTIVVGVVSEHESEGATSILGRRTVLINTRRKRIEGFQG